MSCGCDCTEPTVVTVTQNNGCTTIVVDGTPYTVCEGSQVTCTQLTNGNHVLMIDGQACILPAPTQVVCDPAGIRINGVLCPFPAVSVVDNGNCTGTITVNGVATNFVICEQDPFQHDPAAVTSSDLSLTVSTTGQTFDLTLNEVVAATQLVANPISLDILCTGLTPCILALLPAQHDPATILGSSVVSVTQTGPQAFTVGFNALNAVNSICASTAAKAALIDCVISGDANNAAVVGSDGGVFVAQPPAAVVDINVQGVVFNPGTTTLTLTETDGSVHNVNLASLVNPDQVVVSANAGNMIVAGSDTGALLTADSAVTAICADDSAADALAACLISTDAGNELTQGTDGRLFIDVPAGGVHPTPLQHVTDICADVAAKTALVDCILSNDAGNFAVLGTDGEVFVPEKFVFGVTTPHFNYTVNAFGPASFGAPASVGARTTTINNPSAYLPLNVEVVTRFASTLSDLFCTSSGAVFTMRTFVNGVIRGNTGIPVPDIGGASVPGSNHIETDSYQSAEGTVIAVVPPGGSVTLNEDFWLGVFSGTATSLVNSFGFTTYYRCYN